MKEIATKGTTTYILEKYKLQAKKKFGQNFIIDSNIIHKIVASGNIDRDTFVIEIGPGIGALTQVLANTAGQVRCYEIDTRFKPVYQEFFEDSNIEIIFEDFLTIPIAEEVKKIKQTYKKVCIVANLPYYITTNIIDKIVTSNCAIDSMVVMIQKEVALKFTGTYTNPLLLTLQEAGTISYEFTVSKNVFMPAPHVDSAVIKWEKKKDVDTKLYTVLKVAFTQRRKTIYNNLKQHYPNAEEMLLSSNIPLQARSEALSVEDFKRLTKYL